MSLRKRVIAMNSFLSDVYREDMRTSYLLKSLGYSKRVISQITSNCLNTFVTAETGIIQSQIRSMANGERRLDIIMRRYSLNGEPKWTLQQLAEKHGVSRERIRQIQNQTMRMVRHPTRRYRLEKELCILVNSIGS